MSSTNSFLHDVAFICEMDALSSAPLDSNDIESCLMDDSFMETTQDMVFLLHRKGITYKDNPERAREVMENKILFGRE